MRAGVIQLSQLSRTNRWDAGFNLNVVAIEDRLTKIGTEFEKTPMDFKQIASLVEESDEKNKGGRLSLKAIIFSPDMSVFDKAVAAATRLFGDSAMLADYLPGGHLHCKWFKFFISFAANRVREHLRQEEEKLDVFRSVEERMAESLSKAT